MIRCVNCGSSRLDSDYVVCILCGGSAGVRWEQCHVSREAKVHLLMSATELKAFGIGVELHRTFAKVMGGPKGFGVALDLADHLNKKILPEVISFLRGKGMHAQDILRLRLDEPEIVLAYCLEA